MAHGNQFRRFFCRHDCSNPRNVQSVPFGYSTVSNQMYRFSLHEQPSRGPSHPASNRFLADIDHSDVATRIEMGHFGHNAVRVLLEPHKVRQNNGSLPKKKRLIPPRADRMAIWSLSWHVSLLSIAPPASERHAGCRILVPNVGRQPANYSVYGNPTGAPRQLGYFVEF
jgi:hypothetical protein